MGTSHALTFPPSLSIIWKGALGSSHSPLLSVQDTFSLQVLGKCLYIVIDASRRTVTQQILANYDYANSRYEFVIYFFVKWEGGTGE
jgi:hypothetical protein